jgi:cell division protein FtsA
VIPLGGDHVSHDLSYFFHIPFELAEAVKIKHGHTHQRDVSPLETFIIEPFGDGLPQEVRRKDLADVVEARVEEMFELVHKEIKRSGYDGLLRAGAVITGGSSQIEGLKEVAAAILQCPVRLAKPEKLTGMADTLKNPSYSTSVGLLRMGLNFDTSYEIDDGPTSGSVNGFGTLISNFLRRLLPDDRND